MRELLEKKFFPYVIKPGRYAGGELGQIIKDPRGRLNFLYAHPDKYELGQSHVGLQILYNLINKDDRFLCERVFAVDTDAEEIMRREKIPLFSLESARPAGNFDVIGFSLVNETVYTSMLAMLDLAGLPLRSADRTNEHPIIMAGGPAVYNPEPIAPFVDLFFIGDAEEGLPEMLGILHEMRSAPRKDKLEALCRQVESVYIPAFYDDNRRPVVDFAPEKIKARVVRELKDEYYPEQPLVPLVETVHSHLGIEIMRGCPQGCRFCMAGPIYRPVRIRDKQSVLRQAETQITRTGYEEVSLMSLSTSDYPEIESLAGTLARRLEPLHVSIALPSLRPGNITPALLDAVKRVRRYGITIAPEAGTERLRLFLRKDIPDEAIFDTARMMFEKGWTTIKLYFMIGLPSETQEDLQGIVDLARRIHQIGRDFPGKKTINITLSPFVPKPHTPFQWDQSLPEEELFSRIMFLKGRLRHNQIHIKYNNTQQASLTCVLGRGGRNIAGVIETAYRTGCRFDGWTETFNYDLWLDSFKEHGIDPVQALEAIPFSAELPWSHIAKGVSTEHLKNEREKTSTQLKAYVRPSREAESPAADTPGEFGRGKKRVASRNVSAPTKNRFRVHWGKQATYKYMSHLDNLRMLERALRRARLPVAYSQGYNPTMKLSFGPPLPLGFTSEAEYVDITLDTGFMPHMLDSLRRALAGGIDLLEARSVLGKNKSLSSLLNRVVYQLPIRLWEDPHRLMQQVGGLLEQEHLECQRVTKNETKEIDIRPAVHDMRIEGEMLEMVLGLGEGGYARPTEVAEFLTDGLTVAIPALSFHRKAMYRLEPEGGIVDPMDL